MFTPGISPDRPQVRDPLERRFCRTTGFPCSVCLWSTGRLHLPQIVGGRKFDEFNSRHPSGTGERKPERAGGGMKFSHCTELFLPPRCTCVRSRYRLHFWAGTTTMSLEAARDLSIEDLLHVLNEKIGLECTRVLGIPLPPVFPPASLDTEVSTR